MSHSPQQHPGERSLPVWLYVGLVALVVFAAAGVVWKSLPPAPPPDAADAPEEKVAGALPVPGPAAPAAGTQTPSSRLPATKPATAPAVAAATPVASPAPRPMPVPAMNTVAPAAPATPPVLPAPAAAPGPPLTPEELYAQASPAVGKVNVFDEGGKQLGHGSGFLVSPDGLVVTNFHVIDGAGGATVELPGRDAIQVQGVVAADPKEDLAVLKVAGAKLPSLKLAAGAPKVGAAVYAIGSPEGFSNTLSNGLVSGLRGEKGAVSRIQTSAPISHGSSGGPLLTSDGAVVGVTSAFWGEGQNLNFAIPSTKVGALLAKAAAPVRLANLAREMHPGMGLSYADVLRGLTGRFEMKPAARVHGLPSRSGAAANGTVLVRLSGDPSNIVAIELVLVRGGTRGDRTADTAAVAQLVRNTCPEWNDFLPWMLQNRDAVLDDPDKAATKPIGDKVATLKGVRSKELGTDLLLLEIVSSKEAGKW